MAMSLPGTGRAGSPENGLPGVSPGGLPGTCRAGLPGAGLSGVSPGGLAGAEHHRTVLPGAALLTRIELAVLPTPLVPAPRLAAAMGIDRLQVKRDDLTGFAFGGNKARPLEFLVAAAREQGADTLVTGGAAGSNFCAATAAAARRAGLACQLLIAGQPPQHSPALDLACSWGATVSWTHAAERTSVDTGLPRAAAALAAAGRRPYLIPRGGATALGATGYALAAVELHDQLARRGLRTDCVLVAAGSGGTLAGLLAGTALLGRPWRLVGASVSRPPAEAARRVLRLARDCLSLLAGPAAAGRDGTGREAARRKATGRAATGRAAPGRAAPGQHAAWPAITVRDFDLVDARGPGHGVASADGDHAADTALRTEGLVADPVYTAKALAVLRTMTGERSAVFWHTGGLLDAIAAAGAQR